MPETWELTRRPICDACDNFSVVVYICPAHDRGECLECLYACEPYQDWYAVVLGLGGKVGSLKARIWERAAATALQGADDRGAC